MFLLYLDESGNESDPKDRHFILGGAAIFEQTTFHLSAALDAIKENYFKTHPPIAFHASHIRTGRGFWRDVPRETKTAILREVGQAIADAFKEYLFLFAAVIEKSNQLWGEDAVKLAAEQICNRFDRLLQRMRDQENKTQRGLLIFSKGRFDQRAKIWVRDFRELGTQWRILRHLSDVPYFADMQETRLLQVADYVAYAVFILYEHHDSSLARYIIDRFDQADGVLHGLVHYRANRSTPCDCPACSSRKTPCNFGPWIKGFEKSEIP